jgi:hypothetical protein
MSDDMTAPVNPLVGELQTVQTYTTKDGLTDTQGKVVTRGLAITVWRACDDSKPLRYALTHLATGLAAITKRCGKHIEDAAAAAAAVDIDWTIPDKDDIAAAVKESGFIGSLNKEIGWLCDDHCVGDGPKPPLWEVSCSTCGWVSDVDDGPYTAAEAKRMAADHECEPEMSIRPPGGNWTDPWLVNDDGTVQDVSGGKVPEAATS